MQVSNIDVGLNENFGDFDNVPVCVARTLHENSESQKEWDELTSHVKDKKVTKAKRILNHEAAPLMTLDRLNKLDPDQHVLGWFQKMEQMIEN